MVENGGTIMEKTILETDPETYLRLLEYGYLKRILTPHPTATITIKGIKAYTRYKKWTRE